MVSLCRVGLVTHRVPIESFVPFGHAPPHWAFHDAIWGQTRNSNVGTDTEFHHLWTTALSIPPGLSKHRSGGPSRRGAQIWGQTRCPTLTWGQTRCPVYRSGTFNVQRSTLNFQWGDRKRACWAEYGDRHEIRTTGLLTRRSCPSAGRTVRAGWGTRIWGQKIGRASCRERV